MITLLESPAEITLARNPVVYRFQTTDENGMPYGAKGVTVTLAVYTNSFLTGETLVINWTEPDGIGHQLTFVAVVSPDGINQVPANPTTLSDYQAIAAAIQAHYQLAPYFTVTAKEPVVGVFQLIFQAIQTTDDWAISLDASGLSNFASNTGTPAEADNTPNGYELLLDVYFEGEYRTGDYQLVAQLSNRPGSDGKAVFNISSILEAETRRTQADPPIPNFSNNTLSLANNLRQYYVRFRQNYEGILESPLNPGDDIWQYLGTQKVLCGGIAQNLWADYNFFINLNANNSLLTWYPDGKTVSPNQPEYLPWYNYTSSTKNIVLEVRRFTASSTLLNLFKFDNSGVGVAPMETLLIPCGYDQLEIDNEEVIKYTVRVVDEASDWEGGSPEYLSQARTFYVDYDYYLEKRYLQYLNGFCVPMTLRCVGNFTNELKVERQESTRILPPDYTSSTEEEFQYDQSFENYFTYRSGWLTRWEVDALQECLIYNQLFEVYEEGYIPLHLKTNEMPITETRQQLHAVEFTAVPALKQRSYSNVGIPLEIEQEGWRTSFASFWKTVFGKTWKIS